MGKMNDKAVIITGASTGIGKAMAFTFAKEGANVILGDINKENGKNAEKEITESGGKAKFIYLDVTEEESVILAINEAKNTFGNIHALINNAGGSSLNDKSITEIDLEEFWRAIKIDLYGTVLCCRYVIPELIKAGGGAIVNMGSIAALRGLKGRDAYTAAKGGVTALSRAIAVEHAANNVRCNVIAPGAVLTDRIKHFIDVDPRVRTAVEKHLLGLPEPEEIAQMALFLASDDSKHVTGATFQIDGGRSAAA